MQNNDIPTAQNQTASFETAAAKEKEADILQQFNLAEDILKLEKLNLLHAVSLRMQGGRHPKSEIESLLKRRMDFSNEEAIQGPYLVRLICTLMFIFVCSSLFWGILWLIASALELNYFVRLLSTGISTLVAAMAGVAIFHPSSSPDEKKLKEAINRRLEDLRDQLKKENGANDEIQETTSTDELKHEKEKKDSPKESLADFDDLAAKSSDSDEINRLALEGTENIES